MLETPVGFQSRYTTLKKGANFDLQHALQHAFYVCSQESNGLAMLYPPCIAYARSRGSA